MKNYKKVIAVLMAMSMTAGLTTACNKDSGNGDTTAATGGNNGTTAGTTASGNNNNNNDTTPAPTEDDTPGQYTVQVDPATGKAYDLGGMEIIVRDWWSSGELNEPENGYEEAQQEYRAWIQETYNFKIKEQQVSGWGSVFEDILQYATTGGDENNYVFVLRQAGELVEHMNKELYYDLSTLDCFDFTEGKWDQAIREFGTVNGKTYTMRAMSHEPRTGVYFNKRLLKANGIEPSELYKLQREHKWTWDVFEDYLKKCQKDTDSDGTIDQWSFVTFGSDFYNQAVFSNGGQFIGKDGNGKYYSDLESDKTMQALNWAVGIMEKYNKPAEEGQDWNYFWDEFKNGNAVFFVEQAYGAGQELKEMEDEFGFLAFPMGPQCNTQYSDCNQDNIMVMPACYDADRAWKIAFAYNLYTEPVPGYEDYSDYYSSYLKNFSDIEVAEETAALMGERTVMQYQSYVPGIDMGPQLIWSLGSGEGNTPAAKADEIRETWKGFIDAANGVAPTE